MEDEGDVGQEMESKTSYGQNPAESFLKPKARRSGGGRSTSRMQLPDPSENVAVEGPIRGR